MDSEDNFLGKASGIQSLSSSAQSTPEKNGHSDDVSRGPKLLQEFVKAGVRKDLLHSCFDKEKKQLALSKCKMSEQVPKNSKKSSKVLDQKKASASPNQPTKKQSRKAENPVRIPPSTEPCFDFKCSSSWVCKNSACRATISIDDTFCRRCSCCICHLFDDNKDPSLWVECASDSGQGDHCGLSCHIECALQRGKVGVVDLGQLMQLDGSYCCAACGKVSGILGYWKKQLSVAKDARRVDVLCHRIFLSYRLLDGTLRFKELHAIVKEAKAKLETEVGPVNGVSAKMARGIVSRLSIAGNVQALCSLAIEKADEWLTSQSTAAAAVKEGSLPAACRFLFEEITSNSVVILLIELSSVPPDVVKGYKLWYCKTRDETYPKDPACVFPRSQRRILISSLQPCTEYSFRIVSYTDEGDLGHSEAKCFSKSREIIRKNPNPVTENHRKENPDSGGSSVAGMEYRTSTGVVADSGFKVRDLGKILRLAWAQEQGCLEGFCGADIATCCGNNKCINPESSQEDQPSVARELDLNIASVPDLNEEAIPPAESSRDVVNGGCTMVVPTAGPEDENGVARSHGSGDSQNWNNNNQQNDEVPAVDSKAEASRKRPASVNGETHDSDSTLINGSPFRAKIGSDNLEENFEYCVKVIRWLECEGYIDKDFRLKLLTWFSLRSTEQERRVVHTYIQTLVDDPSSLAGQLVDSFTDIVSSKKPRNGFCTKLWH